MGLLDGKVIAITGAGAGLGRCHALAAAKEGAKLVINDLADGAAEAVCKEVQELGSEAVAHTQDISSEEGAESLIALAKEKFGRIDGLVNNAGILRDKTLKKLPVDHWDMVIQVHLRGTFLCSKAAALAFAEQGEGGKIVNTTSVAGLRGNFGQSNYAAAKAGIYALTRVHSLELGKDKVQVNAIAPIAKTAMTEKMDSVDAELKPELVSPMVVYLLSGLSDDTSGRIFGCHGTHYFEYEMKLSDGVVNEKPWTAKEVAERLGDIGCFETKAPAGQGGDAGLIGRLFELLPESFHAKKAEGWTSVMTWNVAGAGSYTVRVKDSTCTTEVGEAKDATCVVDLDSAVLAGIVDGSVDANQAFMKGQIKASKLPDLGKFGKVFVFDKAFAAKVAGDAVAADSSSEEQGEKPGEGLVNPEAVGLKFRGAASFASPEHIQAYANATNDANPKYQPEAGKDQIGSPIYPVAFMGKLFEKSMTDPTLAINLGRVVHGEQEIVYHKPIHAWDLINPRAWVDSIEKKSSGYLVDLKSHLFCDGEKVVTMSSGIFVRGYSKGEKKPSEKAPVELPEPKFTSSFTVDADQSKRYAKASGDHNPIHLNEEFAKSVGLPGIILHGLCTLAMATGHLVQEGLSGDPARLKRIKVRFSKPVLMGDELTVKVWETAKDDRDITWGFEVVNQRGETVISNGEANVLD